MIYSEPVEPANCLHLKTSVNGEGKCADLTRNLMNNLMHKREFLAASVGAGLGLGLRDAAFAQQASVPAARYGGGESEGNRRTPSRKAKTTKLFKSPPGHPNGIAVSPEGLWISE